MDAILDFARAAAPWLAVGLAVVIMAARGVKRKKKEEKQDGNYGTEGMCLGMCLGTAIGAAFENNTGIGISLGLLIGLAIGMCIPKKTKDANEWNGKRRLSYFFCCF